MRVVEALDEPEHLHARLGPGAETVASEELALQRGEKALTQRVVVAVSRPNPWRDARPPAGSAAQRRPRVYCVPWSEWWMTARGRRLYSAMSSASSTNSARRCVAIDHPTMRRLNASSATARYKNPAHVGT